MRIYFLSVIARVLATRHCEGSCPKQSPTHAERLVRWAIRLGGQSRNNGERSLLRARTLAMTGLICAVLLSACKNIIRKNEYKTYTISVTDLRGKTVQLEKVAERVVCLFNGSFDGMYMLGAEKCLIGIPSNIYTDPEYYDSYAILDERIKNKSISTPGSWQASNIESIVNLHPDLILISAGQKDAIEILEKMNMKVYVVSSETYQQIYKEIIDIGIMTGTEKRAHQLVNYSMQEFEKIRSRTQNVPHKKRVYYAWSGGRILSTSGKRSMINDFIELAGAENVCQSIVDQPNVNPETLIHWNPDVIVLWGTKPAAVYEMSELRSLKAVKNKNVQTMAPAFFYNTHTLKILLASVVLHHWCYDTMSEADIEKGKRDIIVNLYGIRGEKLL